MLGDLLKIFQSDEAVETLSQDDAQIAMAALLVRAARVDHDYDQAEKAQIDAVLQRRFSVDAQTATALRTDAEELERTASDTVRFTRVVKEAVDYEDRQGVLEALWEVILVDEVRDFEEDGFMRLVSNLLGVNDRDNAFARQNVQKRLGI